MNHAAKPVTAEENAWFAAPQPTLVQSALFCVRGITGTRMAWIKLTDTRRQIDLHQLGTGNLRSNLTLKFLEPSAQLDLTSGKFQGVQENVDQVMQLITATAGPRANDECA